MNENDRANYIHEKFGKKLNEIGFECYHQCIYQHKHYGCKINLFKVSDEMIIVRTIDTIYEYGVGIGKQEKQNEFKKVLFGDEYED